MRLSPSSTPSNISEALACSDDNAGLPLEDGIPGVVVVTVAGGVARFASPVEGPISSLGGGGGDSLAVSVGSDIWRGAQWMRGVQRLASQDLVKVLSRSVECQYYIILGPR